MEKQTYVCTEKKEDTVPTPMEGKESKLGNWENSAKMDEILKGKFTGCMKGEETSLYLSVFACIHGNSSPNLIRPLEQRLS